MVTGTTPRPILCSEEPNTSLGSIAALRALCSSRAPMPTALPGSKPRYARWRFQVPHQKSLHRLPVIDDEIRQLGDKRAYPKQRGKPAPSRERVSTGTYVAEDRNHGGEECYAGHDPR